MAPSHQSFNFLKYSIRPFNDEIQTMMKHIRILTLIVALLASLVSMAQASLEIIPPRAVTEGRKFNLTIRLKNGEGKPKAPEIPNCNLLYEGGSSTQQSITFSGGRQESLLIIDYTYVYQALKAGTVTIPAVSVNSGGKQLTSNSVQLTILPPDKNEAPQGQQGGAQYPQHAEDIKVSPEDMFIRVHLNRTQVYEQEPIVATVKIYSKLNISAFRTLNQPTFEGFFSEELPVSHEPAYEHINGNNYTSLELRKVILYPQKTGKLNIESGKYELTLVQYITRQIGFGFVDRVPVEKPVNTESNSAVVTVIPLPSPKPDSFSGAVGSFTAEAQMDPLELRTNEASSYILTVKGTGNLKYLTTPKLDLPDGFDSFTPKTDIDARFTGNDMAGTYTVNYTVVPQHPGTFAIPASKFAYFNPKDKAYHTIDLPAFSMKVAQGAAVETGTEQTAILSGMSDIRHLRPVNDSSVCKQPGRIFHAGWYWCLYALCAAALGGTIFAYRRHIRLHRDVQGLKLARANKMASKRLRAARQFMTRKDSDRFYMELNQAMTGYLSDKLGIPASQLLRENIIQKLTDRGMHEAEIQRTIDILDECEMARFTPDHSETEMSDLYNRAASAIKNIESAKKTQSTTQA